jgi:tRNA-specific 2-thiouridylase
VCLSGGVDSTAALLRCSRLFSSVRAVYVQTSHRTPPEQAYESCRQLGIEFSVADARVLFNTQIKQFTLDAYRSGITPNPCALCNARVKLAVPFSMLGHGECLVTGHYAGNSVSTLERGMDSTKDQSYFLSLVPGEILDRCFFPLAKSHKGDVRAEVLESGLPFLERESQDLCFQRAGAGVPGDVVDTDGNTVGRHNGLDSYTPGQRKGFGAHNGRKYVVRLDILRNRLIIGEEEYLYSEYCILNSINWLNKPVEEKFTCMVQIRYRKTAVPADVFLNGDGTQVVVKFHRPQKAVAPGQVGVMFLSDSVIGGGIIDRYEGDTYA